MSQVYLPSNYAGLLDLAKDVQGCLFAAALTTIVLTNGSRLSELLQISADRFT